MLWKINQRVNQNQKFRQQSSGYRLKYSSFELGSQTLDAKKFKELVQQKHIHELKICDKIHSLGKCNIGDDGCKQLALGKWSNLQKLKIGFECVIKLQIVSELKVADIWCRLSGPIYYS